MRPTLPTSVLLAGTLESLQFHAPADGGAKGSLQGGAQSRGVVHSSPEETRPLKVGDKLPKLEHLRDSKGTHVDLGALRAERPAVLVFYRGGWCPFCTVHLGDLARVQPSLAEGGVSILAISPDSPETVSEYAKEHALPYTLLSDNQHEAMKAFGIAFAVEEDMRKMLLDHGMDLVASSGNPEAVLPVPSVFVIDRDGTITFAHANPDYKVRLSGEEVLRAAGVGTMEEPSGEENK